MQISLLGRVSIEVDGKPVDRFASRKAEALLAYLVCHQRPFPRDILANVLWPFNEQSRALANLSVILSSLRKQLKRYIIADRHTVGFNHDAPYQLDVQLFEQALKNSRAAFSQEKQP